jgi:hypothetical protein
VSEPMDRRTFLTRAATVAAGATAVGLREDPERDAVDFAVLPPFEGVKIGSDAGGGVDAGQA